MLFLMIEEEEDSGNMCFVYFNKVIYNVNEQG